MEKDHKVTATIWIRQSVRDRAKAAHLPISQVTEAVLEHLLNMQGQNEEEIKLAILLSERQQHAADMEKLQAKLAPHSERLAVLDARIDEQRKICAEIRRSEEIANAMKLLNARIRETNYDKQSTWEVAVTEIERLRTLGVTIDDAWLERQCKRVAQLDDSF